MPKELAYPFVLASHAKFDDLSSNSLKVHTTSTCPPPRRPRFPRLSSLLSVLLSFGKRKKTLAFVRLHCVS
jgi:hypothetical protein